ncbi:MULTISPECIES: Bug family tripartite tricarboxylate transporter substrate binding protein [Ramlibacter]|uniref:Tripartite tricarboxylate transporter substrate binding protein n=1 Tax=Ramlibacter pinisoli TaxID=2682844 RepID=A0A6N8IYN3_9BURK|nr:MULTISPECIES: tripartite tricarboxylate transporter substrate binding protein [Ramlibacter]MBA2961994.1 tripartite tricarboxylate transporter substrate binding protein [Ramlibacter sp. CGMCC 1.13660]MVQ31937.1 tripartite tricarboxylate transporter substrate binding protein [Ramlibacter pinisoli]
MNHVNSSRRRLLAAAALALAAAPPAFAQATYPTKPIRLVVAYPPGGPLDVLARSLAQPLGDALGQPIVVDNRAGAGGVIGSDFVAKAAPDGYTLLFGSTPLSIQETLLPKLPYSVYKDFTPIANMAVGPQALVVGNSVPVSNVQELIDYGKAQNGRLNYASPSAGGSNHLAAEMFKSMAGFSATHVPYKGGAPAEIDLIAGQVTFMFGAFSSSLAQAEKGRLKVLGVSSKKRMAKAPNVPTIAETLPGFEVESWYGVLGPPGLPPAIAARLNAEVNKILGSDDMKKRFTAMDLEATPWTPQQFSDYIRQNTAMWAKVIKDANVKPE